MEQIKPRSIPEQDAQWPAEYMARDEISLFDLWAVLVRRKWTILAVWLLTVGLAAAYAFVTPAQYQFSMPVEIGGKAGPDNTLERIESPKAVVAKLEKNYIPLAIATFLEERDSAGWEPKIKANSPESSDIVVLQAEGALGRREAYAGLFQSVVDALAADHGNATALEKTKLTARIDATRNAVRSAEEEIQRLKDEMTRLDERQELIKGELETLEQQLASFREQRRAVAESAGNETAANTLAMLTSDINSLTARIGELRTVLRVELPSERAKLQSGIHDQQRAVENRRAEAGTLEAQRESLLPTRALSAIQRSVSPTGPGNAVILALGIILGLMLGIFAAFAAEFIAQANRHARGDSLNG